MKNIYTSSFWKDDTLYWRVSVGVDVKDSDLRAWCHRNMDYPFGYVGACVLKLHTDAYAKAMLQASPDLLHAARRVLSANQEAQPHEYHLAMEELKRAVEMAANGKGME